MKGRDPLSHLLSLTHSNLMDQIPRIKPHHSSVIRSRTHAQTPCGMRDPPSPRRRSRTHAQTPCGMRDPPSPRRPLSRTIWIARQLHSPAAHASLPPSPLSRCGGTAFPYGAHISPSLLMWSGMVGAPNGARAAAAAAPSHGARVSQGGDGRIQPWGLWRAPAGPMHGRRQKSTPC